MLAGWSHCRHYVKIPWPWRELLIWPVYWSDPVTDLADRENIYKNGPSPPPFSSFPLLFPLLHSHTIITSAPHLPPPHTFFFLCFLFFSLLPKFVFILLWCGGEPVRPASDDKRGFVILVHRGTMMKYFWVWCLSSTLDLFLLFVFLFVASLSCSFVSIYLAFHGYR